MTIYILASLVRDTDTSNQCRTELFLSGVTCFCQKQVDMEKLHVSSCIYELGVDSS